ncbi:MAG TPA: glucokinase, partial [Acidimicrobiaceae bacterium]|nr:glucokinase [Acidimicrobiaceae bacterium]
MLIGIDIGGTKASALLVDPTTWAIVGRERTTSEGDGPTLVDNLARMVDGLRERSPTPVRAVGLGIAGLAGRSGTLAWSPNLPDRKS